MANVLAPNGFQLASLYGAAAPNLATREATIAYNYTTKIAYGDPVYLYTDGTIRLYAAGGTTIHGIFRGCKYLDPSTGRTNWFRYWNGPTLPSTTAVTAYVDCDPQSVFQAQVNGGPVVQSNIGQNIDITTSTSGAPTISGQSVCSLSFATIADTATLPFRIVGIVSAPAVNFLYDGTQANNWAVVMLNTSDITTRTGQA